MGRRYAARDRVRSLHTLCGSGEAAAAALAAAAATLEETGIELTLLSLQAARAPSDREVSAHTQLLIPWGLSRACCGRLLHAGQGSYGDR